MYSGPGIIRPLERLKPVREVQIHHAHLLGERRELEAIHRSLIEKKAVGILEKPIDESIKVRCFSALLENFLSSSDEDMASQFLSSACRLQLPTSIQFPDDRGETHEEPSHEV